MAMMENSQDLNKQQYVEFEREHGGKRGAGGIS